MAFYYDFEAAQRREAARAELEKAGKRCTKCAHYRKYDNPSRGGCAGWCEKKKTDYPDKHLWWGVSKKNVCCDFVEVQ